MKMPLLTPFEKVNYSLGSTAEAIAYTATASFLLLFYNQVQGLPAGHVGTALAAGLIVNALFDPLVGSWSDRTKSKLGRRHPFMFAAIIPAAALFWAVFNPPAEWGETGKLIWLAVCNTMLLQAMTLYHTPHLALGGEMSNDYLGRTSIMGFNTVCLWLGDTIAWVLSFRFFFASSAEFKNGALDPSRWPAFSASFGIAILLLLSYSSWSTRKFIPFLPRPAEKTAKFGLAEWARDAGRALSNRNYVVLLVGLFFLSMMIGVRGGLSLYTLSYYWQLTNDQIGLFVIGSFCGYAFAATVVKHVHAKFEKRWTGTFAVMLYAVGPAIAPLLGWLGIISYKTVGIMWIVMGLGALGHIAYSLMTTTVYSALADIADENELKYGIRQEGVLYSTRTFFARIDQALGTALAGWVLALIAFPAKAVPGAVDQTVLSNLALATILSTIPGLFAAASYSFLKVTRATHDATRAAIDEKKRMEDEAISPSPAT
jgi:glycoside/pentoside/hexuronide:cation symporter, GPH family